MKIVDTIDPLAMIQIGIARKELEKLRVSMDRGTDNAEIEAMLGEEKEQVLAHGKKCINAIEEMLNFAATCKMEGVATIVSNLAFLYIINPHLADNLTEGFLLAMMNSVKKYKDDTFGKK